MTLYNLIALWCQHTTHHEYLIYLNEYYVFYTLDMFSTCVYCSPKELAMTCLSYIIPLCLYNQAISNVRCILFPAIFLLINLTVLLILNSILGFQYEYITLNVKANNEYIVRCQNIPNVCI